MIIFLSAFCTYFILILIRISNATFSLIFIKVHKGQTQRVIYLATYDFILNLIYILFASKNPKISGTLTWHSLLRFRFE